MANLNERLNTLFANESFAAEAKTVTSVEEMQKLMAKYDVEMSAEEIVEMCTAIAKRMAEDEELNEDALENVAGGVIPGWWIAVGVVCVGAFALGVYNGLKG